MIQESHIAFDVQELYHISTINHDMETFFPRVPQHRMKEEDGITPRVCFAESIEGAMTAIGLNPVSASEQFFFVHIPEDFNELMDANAFINPSELVPDADETHEIWCVEPVKLRCIAFVMAYVDWNGHIKLEELYMDPDPKYTLYDLIARYDEECEEEYEKQHFNI